MREADGSEEPAQRVIEGVIVGHAGLAHGSTPRDAAHPDVAAARDALSALKPAVLSDRTDVTEPDEEDRHVRGYMIQPRGSGRIAVYWIESGQLVRRDHPWHGLSLDCIADKLRRCGWLLEPMGRSALCVFAHRPLPRQRR